MLILPIPVLFDHIGACLRVQRISSTQFPPLTSWNPLEYYNLFSLASQYRKTELKNYEFFNCSRYCEFFQQTEIGSKVSQLSREAKHSLDTATRTIEDEVELRMEKIKMNEKVSRMSDSIKRMKDKLKAVYREKVKAKLDGIVEGASKSSKGFKGRIESKMGRFKQRMREFYDERKVGPSTSYFCIGHQMRNFILSSVLLQHVAFSVLLWRHWNKSDAARFASPNLTLGLLGVVAAYWVFALISMFTKSVPQWILYLAMSLVLVHMAPFQIVAFDFLLLLLTIALATISVFDIYHRLYKTSLIGERSVLQDHLLMALQVTILFLHLSSPSLVTFFTLLVTILTWKDFISFFHLQRGARFWHQARELVSSQASKWVIVAFSNIAWLSTVQVSVHLLPFSLLHPHLHLMSLSNLAILAAELTILHCAILIKYQMRYPDETLAGQQLLQQQAQNAVQQQPQAQLNQNGAAPANQVPPALANLAPGAIPPPPPLPPHWQNQLPQPLIAAAAPQAQNPVQPLLPAAAPIPLNQQPNLAPQPQQGLRQGPQPGANDQQENVPAEGDSPMSSLSVLHPTLYWHYVWILGVFCDFLMGLLDRFGMDGLSQTLSLVLPIIVLVAVLPIQIHYWNNKWNYDMPCAAGPHLHIHN